MLGVVTLWPPAYIVLFLIAAALEEFESAIVILHAFTALLLIVLLVIYVVHVFRNERLPDERKTLWATVILLGSAFAMPVYWWQYIWGERRRARRKLTDAPREVP